MDAEQVAEELALISINQLVIGLARDATTRTAGQTVALLRAFEEGIGVDDRAAIWKRLRDRAQRAIVQSYIQTRRTGGPAGYRQQAYSPSNRRDAGGRLLRALRSPNLIRINGDGLDFVNVRLLDDAARQWARLNAGTEPISAGVSETYDIYWSNMVAASIGLQMDARPAFSIPSGMGRRGYWTSSGEFHPAGEGPAAGQGGGSDSSAYTWVTKRPTKGIQARNFLGAGARRFAADVGPEFTTMYRRSYANAESRAAMASAGIVVTKPTRPPSFRVVRR